MWVNILVNGFNFTLGLLAGISLLETFLLIFTTDRITFIASFTTMSNIITILNIVFVNIAFVFGLTLTMIYNQFANSLRLVKDANRL